MFPPTGQKTEQGYELQIGTMVLGHFLFTAKLTQLLIQAASSAPANSVRVIWAGGSLGLHLYSPADGVSIDVKGHAEIFKSQQTNYGQAKCGNLYMASEFGRLHARDGIVSACFNPGNLQTELQRHSGGVANSMAKAVLHPAIFGACLNCGQAGVQIWLLRRMECMLHRGAGTLLFFYGKILQGVEE